MSNIAILRAQRIQAYHRARMARLPSDIHFAYTDTGVRCSCGANAAKQQDLQHTTSCFWLTRKSHLTRVYLDAVQAWRSAFRAERSNS